MRIPRVTSRGNFGIKYFAGGNMVTSNGLPVSPLSTRTVVEFCKKMVPSRYKEGNTAVGRKRRSNECFLGRKGRRSEQTSVL